MFQSRNGLIWTDWAQEGWSIVFGFNPATVWFEQRLLTALQEPVIWFQSRNGLIWTSQPRQETTRWYIVSIPQRSDLNSIPARRDTPIWQVSIPQRSDLNHVFCFWCGMRNNVSIPQRSDLNEERIHQPRRIYVSIPQRSDLNTFSRAAHRSSSRVSIPQRSDLNINEQIAQHTVHTCFNPATVWFEPATLDIYSWPYSSVSIPQRSDLN